MNFDLNGDERDVLVHLLDEAIREIGPEIRHTMTSTYKDDLKQQRRILRTLHDRLTTTAGSRPAAPSSEFTSPTQPGPA